MSEACSTVSLLHCAGPNHLYPCSSRRAPAPILDPRSTPCWPAAQAAQQAPPCDQMREEPRDSFDQPSVACKLRQVGAISTPMALGRLRALARAGSHFQGLKR